jgi:glycosyltransferase involved in cell wall biosynthesis
MKIAIVVQRYGAEINGGAELHARYIAEHLARHVQVEVLTTCASDYITWRNALPAGEEVIRGITVRRFPVTREREPAEFGRLSERVFTQTHAVRDELAWLDAEGPTSPALLAYIAEHEREFDFFLFFSVRYYHAFHGARLVPHKAIIVPTAERDAALGLAVFAPIFRGVRAFMYNSLEERALIQAVAGHRDVPGVVVGVGSEIPAHSQAARFRQKFDIRDRFAIYIGRIDENKGCAELFDYFQRYTRMLAEGMHLVLIGNPIIPVPKHPKIHHLGFVDDQDKFDALAAADLLVMPSYFESLSMVAVEAWALGRPVLANGRCDVLKGQCIRSNGGLYYESFPEFIETLRAIDFNPMLAAALGRNGRDYFQRNYTWPIIERKYLDMLERLSRESGKAAMEPLPGWFARRRNDLPPANEVLGRLPSGAAVDERQETVDRRAQPRDVNLPTEPREAPRRPELVPEAQPAAAAVTVAARAPAPDARRDSSGRRPDHRGGPRRSAQPGRPPQPASQKARESDAPPGPRQPERSDAQRPKSEGQGGERRGDGRGPGRPRRRPSGRPRGRSGNR